MKSHIMFLQCITQELGDRCDTSTSQDLKTILARTKHEGNEFLTITLPNFGKDFERCLDLGYVADDAFLGFERRAGLPQFLGGFLQLVFSRDTGRLVDQPSIPAIYAIRQITLLFGKIKEKCSDTRTQRAFDDYVNCEREVVAHVERLTADTEKLLSFSRIGRLLFADLFTAIDLTVYNGGLLGRHGPGNTADRISGNRKYDSYNYWPRRLESGYFPQGELQFSSWSFYSELLGPSSLEPGTFGDIAQGLLTDDPLRDIELPSRVVDVPKTAKTPRIIALEPTAVQYCQQALLREFEHLVPKDDILGKMIAWNDQTPNQRLALQGSLYGDLATLDLSEASDRVPDLLVRTLLANHPHLAGAVAACRTTKADVPGHGIIPLAKFASMGSALCFPMESMVFLTTVLYGIEQKLNRLLTKKDIYSFIGRVRVYGDDIIVPVDFVSAVYESLENFGFKVNSRKSFWTGKFRESCGKEYYDGADVSVVRFRQYLPSKRQQTDKLQSAVSLRNQLFHKGYEKSVDWLDKWILDLIPFPYGEATSALLVRHTHFPIKVVEWDSQLQRPLIKGVVVVPVRKVSKLDGAGALMKVLLRMEADDRYGNNDSSSPFTMLPSIDEDHLQFAGRPVSFNIKTRKAPPR